MDNSSSKVENQISTRQWEYRKNTRKSINREVPFDMLGEKFVDGSLTSEVPKNQLRSLFQVNQFIISQVHPRIAGLRAFGPFIVELA